MNIQKKADNEIKEEIVADGSPDSDVHQDNISIPQNNKELYTEKTTSKKGKLVITKFFGNELIREKVLVDGIPVTRISIRGNATINHNGVLIQSPLIILDAGKKGVTVGGVVIHDPSSGMKIKAQNAIYDKDEENVSLSGNPYMILQKNKNEAKTLITTNKMIRDLSKKETVLDGDVRIFREGWSVIGDKGVQKDSTDEIVLEKDPVILDKNRFLTGDRLIYELKKKNILLDGRVFSLSLDKEDLKNQFNDNKETIPLDKFARLGGKPEKNDPVKKEKPDLTVISSDKMIYDSSNNEFSTAELNGNVLMTQEDFYLKTPVLKSRGKGFSEVYTENGVEMLDKKENIHVTAGEMFYQREKRFMRLDLYPKMEFLKKESTEVEGVLEAAVIESDFKIKQTLARGNVVLTQKDFTATGERALYKSQEDLIIMEGSPSINRGTGAVRSEKILIYPRENRVLLQNRIRGSIKPG